MSDATEPDTTDETDKISALVPKIVGGVIALLVLWFALRFVTRWLKWLALGVAVGVIYYFVVSRSREDDEHS